MCELGSLRMFPDCSTLLPTSPNVLLAEGGLGSSLGSSQVSAVEALSTSGDSGIALSLLQLCVLWPCGFDKLSETHQTEGGVRAGSPPSMGPRGKGTQAWKGIPTTGERFRISPQSTPVLSPLIRNASFRPSTAATLPLCFFCFSPTFYF